VSQKGNQLQLLEVREMPDHCHPVLRAPSYRTSHLVLEPLILLDSVAWTEAVMQERAEGYK